MIFPAVRRYRACDTAKLQPRPALVERVDQVNDDRIMAVQTALRVFFMQCPMTQAHSPQCHRVPRFWRG